VIRYSEDKLPIAGEKVSIQPVKHLTLLHLADDILHPYFAKNITGIVLDRYVYVKNNFPKILGFKMKHIIPVQMIDGKVLIVSPLFLTSEEPIDKVKKKGRKKTNEIKKMILDRIAELKRLGKVNKNFSF